MYNLSVSKQSSKQCTHELLLSSFAPTPTFYQTQETHALITTVLDVQPRLASTGGGKTNDEIVYELAESILNKIPEKLDIEKAVPELFEV